MKDTRPRVIDPGVLDLGFTNAVLANNPDLERFAKSGRGSLMVVVGPTGSGKRLVLDAIALLHTQDKQNADQRRVIDTDLLDPDGILDEAKIIARLHPYKVTGAGSLFVLGEILGGLLIREAVDLVYSGYDVAVSIHGSNREGTVRRLIALMAVNMNKSMGSFEERVADAEALLQFVQDGRLCIVVLNGETEFGRTLVQ